MHKHVILFCFLLFMKSKLHKLEREKISFRIYFNKREVKIFGRIFFTNLLHETFGYE